MAIDKTFLENAAAPVDRSDNPFWWIGDVDPLLWNRSLPYQLKLVEYQPEKQDMAKVTTLLHDMFDTTTMPSIPRAIDAGYRDMDIAFTLPVAPQDLSISMPIATNVQATLNGIVEQHGGAPFRDIIINGTTGFTPVKNNAAKQIEVGGWNSVGSIFSGSLISGINSVASQFANLGSSNVNNGVSASPDENSIDSASTGYYQYRILQKFIESYVELKKNNVNIKGVDSKNIRLAFCNWKDESVYLCSGVQFNTKKSASSPMEYSYTLQLKGWKRVKLNNGTSRDYVFAPVSRRSNGYQDLLQAINKATDIVLTTGDSIEAAIGGSLRQLGNLTGTLLRGVSAELGAAQYISHLPDSIQQEYLNTIGQPAVYKKLAKQYADIFGDNTPMPEIYINRDTNFGKIDTSQGYVPDFQGYIPPQYIGTLKDRGVNIAKLLSSVPIDSIPVAPATRNRAQQTITDSKNTTRKQYEDMGLDLSNIITNFSNAVGLGSTTTNQIENNVVVAQIKVPTDEEFRILYALNDLKQALDSLAVSTLVNRPTPTSIEYIAGLAQKSGIAFQVPTSKFAIPFPYGMTLEKLAVTYLGSANRWHEIAALNGLMAPYVDEVGFSLLFLTNGNGNKLYVSDVTNLYKGQVAYISSNNRLRSKRQITNIVKIYDNFYEVTVDGNSDLTTFLAAAQAKLEAFLPNTVNSQQVIYIPSDKAAPLDPKTKQIPGIDEMDPLLQVSGIDLLLTPQGDLAITEDGDCKLAYGLQNITQTVKLALLTQKGELIQHPQYGITLEVGSSTADVDVNDVAKSIKNMFSGDDTFEAVDSIHVNKNGPSVAMTLVLKIKGVSQLIPITFNLK